MAKSFRVVDLREKVASDAESIMVHAAASPEAAARAALGEELVRSGSKRHMVAKVYWQTEGQPMTMVRLYARVTSHTE
jgi:hypothetical protein